MPNVDPSNHVPWLESKRRSRARRAEARKARSRARRRKTGAIVAAASLTFAVGGAVAHDNIGSTSVHGAGSTVSRLQSVLGITPDGVYGANTRRAVRNYQRNQGLTVDGIAGPVTLASLGLASPSASRSVNSAAAASTSAPSSTLQKIAMCESSGNPAAVNSTGKYRGKYQFDAETWAEFGGTGDPAAALLAARGTSPWPVCGKGV